MSDSSLFHTLVGIREVNDKEFRMVALMDIPKGLPDLIFLSLDSIICCSYPVVIAPTATNDSPSYRGVPSAGLCATAQRSAKRRIGVFLAGALRRRKFHKSECELYSTLSATENATVEFASRTDS